MRIEMSDGEHLAVLVGVIVVGIVLCLVIVALKVSG